MDVPNVRRHVNESGVEDGPQSRDLIMMVEVTVGEGSPALVYLRFY